MGARKLPCGVSQITHIRRYEVADVRLAREWKAGGPFVLDHLERQLRQKAAASTQVDARRESFATRQLLDAEREALQQHLGVRGEKLGHLAVLVLSLIHISEPTR